LALSQELLAETPYGILRYCDKVIILITRDPCTAFKLITKGYYYAASIMGAAPTEEQKDIIKRYEYAFCD
jgi:hypothetical protein